MAAVHPSPERIAALRRRWEGQEARLRAIASSLLAGEDWTIHLVGLPYVDEVPPRPGEAYGRDLRGALLDRFLQPDIELREAEERDAALVAGVTLEGLRNNTPLPDVSPFPVDIQGAEQVALAIRRGERFVLARAGYHIVGVVQWAERREFQDLTADRPYAEISGLAVLPPWRRKGIGERLLREAEQSACRRAHDHALLRTTYELGLVPWYERLGYVACFTRQMTYTDSPTFLDVVMVRRITSRPEASPGTSSRLRSRACLEAPPATRSRSSPPPTFRAEAATVLERTFSAVETGFPRPGLSMR
jgi:ribosomal protein S18 acetylase RimI-like enzyme